MKKYVLYGVGLDCEIFCYKNKDIIPQIAYCIDQNRNGESFYDIPIYFLDNAPDLNSYTILVTTRWELYEQIKPLLIEHNLSEFKDFMWHCCFRKKIVAINMNCHCSYLPQYLNESSFFQEHYCIIPVPFIQENQDRCINDSLICNCDVYIHQDIQADNAFGYKLSDEYILPKLKKTCLSITVPNFVGMVHYLYPQHSSLFRFPFNSRDILFHNLVIDEAIKNGIHKFDDLLKFYEEYTYDPTSLNNTFIENMDKLQSREKNWDIKVSEYIKEHFHTIPLFNDHSHPSNYLLHYIYEQIAIFLKLPDYPKTYNYPPIGLPMPILPSVAKHFDLHYETESDKLISKLTREPLTTLEEYIKYYCWCVYHIDL